MRARFFFTAWFLSTVKTAATPSAYEYYALDEPNDADARGDGVGGSEGVWVYRAAVALLTQPFENAVADFLQFAGASAGADRAWIIRYNPDATQFYNTHEWCRPGVPSYVEDLQHTPVSMIAWLHDRLVRKEAVMINAADKLPRTARALQAEFARQKDRSVLCVPIFHEGRIFAIIGFDTVRAPRNWPHGIAHALSRCGTLIAVAWTQQPASPGATTNVSGTATTSANTHAVSNTDAAGFDADAGHAATPAMRSAETKTATKPVQIYLHQGGAVRGVPLHQILAVSAEGDYTRVHLAQNVSALELRPLKAWVSFLPRADFQQVHRGALVNVHQVESLERPTSGSWNVRVRGLTEPLRVSKAFRAEVRSRLGF